MPREELSPTYASPGLRWGIFKEDYPNGTYRFSMMKGTELDPPVPVEFGGGDDFVVCVLDKADGTPPVTGYKEVPATVERWTGPSHARSRVQVAFERTPDNWQVLCTKALGRALKRAGYPDDTKDLKALILWRQRRLELAAIETGMKLTPLAITTGSAQPDDIDRAGTADHYGDRERDPEDPDDAEVLPTPEISQMRWCPEAAERLRGFSEQTVREIYELAVNRGINIEQPAQNLPVLLSIIDAKRPAHLPLPAVQQPSSGPASQRPTPGPGAAAPAGPLRQSPPPPPPRDEPPPGGVRLPRRAPPNPAAPATYAEQPTLEPQGVA